MAGLTGVDANLTEIFASALREARPDARVDELGYAGFADSLLEGLEPARLSQAFPTAEGRGPESRQPRLYAAHSDLMMLVNVMSPWLDDLAVMPLLGRQGWRELRFELRLPAVEGVTAEWLPGLLVAPDRIVGIESETTDYMSGSRIDLPDALEEFWASREENGWRRQMLALKRGEQGYAQLDASRLIRQYTGLRLLMEALASGGAPPVPAVLLYLYWEPLNAARFEVFEEHHHEIERFREAVAGSDIEFAPVSYLDLWAGWSSGPAPSWLAMHLARLHRRYSFRI